LTVRPWSFGKRSFKRWAFDQVSASGRGDLRKNEKSILERLATKLGLRQVTAASRMLKLPDVKGEPAEGARHEVETTS